MPALRQSVADRLRRRETVPACVVGRVAFGLGICLAPEGAAHAQVTDSVLISPQIPEPMVPFQDLSVKQQPQDLWQAQGHEISSFKVFPEIAVGQSLTSNAYANSEAKAAAIENLVVSLDARSLWSRHALDLHAYRAANLYVGNRNRNENNWSLALEGNVEVTGAVEVELQARADQLSVNRLSGDAAVDGDAVIVTRQDMYSAKVTRTYNAMRAFVSAEHFRVDYGEVLSGSSGSSSYFDHTMDRVAGQGEYSFTPSVTAFVQANYSWIDYGTVSVQRAANASSDGGRVLAGGRFAVPGLGRATVSVGYSRRSYDRAGLSDIKGMSAEARLEAFVSPLTTITAEFGSRIADARLLSGIAYREKYAQVSADHALLRNLKLSLNARVLDQKPLNSTGESRLITTRFTASYLSSRHFQLDGTMSYSTRHYTAQSRPDINELTGGVTLTYKL